MLEHVPNFPDPGSMDHKTHPIYLYFQKCYKLNAQFQNPKGRSYILGSPSPVDCTAVAEMTFLDLFGKQISSPIIHIYHEGDQNEGISRELYLIIWALEL